MFMKKFCRCKKNVFCIMNFPNFSINEVYSEKPVFLDFKILLHTFYFMFCLDYNYGKSAKEIATKS